MSDNYKLFINKLSIVPDHWDMNNDFINLYLYISESNAQAKFLLKRVLMYEIGIRRSDLKTYEAFGKRKH